MARTNLADWQLLVLQQVVQVAAGCCPQVEAVLLYVEHSGTTPAHLQLSAVCCAHHSVQHMVLRFYL
jgi:hypothetical protein